MLENRELLGNLLRQRSVRVGDFKLASGQRSDIYVDAKLTTCHSEAMPLVGKVFIEKMNQLGWHPSAVGGLTMGADPIAMAIARESLETGHKIDAFVVRKEPKQHGLEKYIEGLALTKGVPVVIIDDVCTTGGSTAKAIERAKDAGLEVVGALCLVDREMGAAQTIEAILGCQFDRIFTLKDLQHEPVGALASPCAARSDT